MFLIVQFNFFPRIELFVDGKKSKILFSVVKQSGSESYEMRISLLVGIGASILCFFILESPSTILNFGLPIGFFSFPVFHPATNNITETLCKGFNDLLVTFRATVLQDNSDTSSAVNYTVFKALLSIFCNLFIYLFSIVSHPSPQLDFWLL